MGAYYNENDPFAAQWLRNLIAAGHIAPGEVDTRSIEDVSSDDLRGFQQCHFFAGIGVWSKALRDAGWPDDRVVWTGSCPCQPFSAAGKRGGTTDERHLWPAFYHLIEERRPPIVLGEQVASKDGLAWLDTVHADMEASGYAVGAADLCAAGVGAPHIRQRLWFVGVADATHQQQHGSRDAGPRRWAEHSVGSAARGLGHHHHQGLPQQLSVTGVSSRALGADPRQAAQRTGSSTGGLADAVCGRAGHDTREGVGAQAAPHGSDGSVSGQRLRFGVEGSSCERPGPTNGLWRDADWLLCRDDKWRPVRPGTFPLVNGAPSRVGRLRAYGNAIVAEAAREFIGAVTDALGSP